MKIPVETKPALWGAAGGAVALAIIGFNWGGWVTGSKAESMAATRANDAVVAALAPGCVVKFDGASDAAANRVALGKLESWTRAEYVEKGGWAAYGKDAPADRVTAVARACAELLVKPVV